MEDAELSGDGYAQGEPCFRSRAVTQVRALVGLVPGVQTNVTHAPIFREISGNQ